MNIEELPSISQLERFAQGLPPEQQAEAYRIAETFYRLGKSDNAIENTQRMALLFKPNSETEITNLLPQYLAYFARRVIEAEQKAKEEKVLV